VAKAYLEPAEIEKLEEAAEFLRDRLLIRLLFHLGCRISEALGITVGNIDFSHGTVTIQHLKARITLSCPQCETRLSKSHRFCPGCRLEVEKAIAQEKEHQRLRTLPVDEATLNMLKEYIKRDVNSETGKVHNVSPHRLRDAFAVHAVKLDDSGDGLRMLQEHLGHRSITTTMRYRKVSGEEQKEWYERLWQGGKQDG